MSILIVDDEDEILATLKSHLELENIKCTTASTAQEALSLHQSHLFPVVLTDIRMPEISGVDLLKSLKKTHPTCIVFVMTGYATLDNLIECLELGAVDYFTKPFKNIDALVNNLKEALARHQRWMKDLIQIKKEKS